MPIHVLKTCLILLGSCPMRGRFLEAILQRTERKLAGPGAPGRSTAWWPVERWEALRLALGARGALPREVGSPPASRVSHWASWRLPPLHRLARFARDWQTSDALRRENAKAWLFENLKHRPRVPDAVRHSSCRSAEPGPCQTPALCTAPALQRTASQVLRAALRPGHEGHCSGNPSIS